MGDDHLAYLQPRRAVAWKCLSILEDANPGELAPVAYASTSDRFLAKNGKDRRGTLWVVTRGMPDFPASIVARMEVDDIRNGEEIRDSAPEFVARLDVKPGHESFERWRQARVFDSERDRAVFRIARVFARNLRKRNRKRREVWAWSRVRVGIAGKSAFLPHRDDTDHLRRILEMKGRLMPVTQMLQGPRWVDNAEPPRSKTPPIFLSYRRNRRQEDALALARHLVHRGCSVWLDRLAIPDFTFEPRWNAEAGKRPGVSSSRLAHLLNDGIARSGVFLAIAGRDYSEPVKPGVGNWAHSEFTRACRSGLPVGVVDLGEAPEEVTSGATAGRWTWSGNARETASEVWRSLVRM